MCFEGVNRCFVFCLSFSPLLDYLNPNQIHCTFLSLSFSSLASFCLADARGERERERTHAKLKKRKEDEDKEERIMVRVC